MWVPFAYENCHLSTWRDLLLSQHLPARAVLDNTREAPKGIVNHHSRWLCAGLKWRGQRKWPCDLQGRVREDPGASASIPGHLSCGTPASCKEPDSPYLRVGNAPAGTCLHAPAELLAKWMGHHGHPAQLSSQGDCNPACHLTAITGEPLWEESPSKNCSPVSFPNPGSAKPWARENGCCATPPSVRVCCHAAVVSGKHQCVRVCTRACTCVCVCTHMLNGVNPRHREPYALGEKSATSCVTCTSALLSLSLVCYQQVESRSPFLMGLWKLMCSYL